MYELLLFIRRPWPIFLSKYVLVSYYDKELGKPSFTVIGSTQKSCLKDYESHESALKYTLHEHHIFITHLFLIHHMHSRSWNIGPTPKIHNTRSRARMENEERAHLESHYQTELESVKNEVSRLTDLLGQLLRAKNGEGTSAQQLEGAPTTHIPQASQNQGANSANGQ
jgi:hypothetical protein